MTITIELGLELQAELIRQATAHGMDIDKYAASLLLEPPIFRLRRVNPSRLRPQRKWWKRLSGLKIFGKTRGLSLGGMTIRELRHEARR